MRSISAPSGSLTRPDERTRFRNLRSISWGLFFTALTLSAIGLATVQSASSELVQDYFPRQLLWVGIGLIVFCVGLGLDYHFLLRIATPLYLIGLAALALVLVFGHEAGGARSWVGLGGLGLQPSEYVKLATALLLSRYLGSIKQPNLDLRQVAAAAAIVAVPMILVVLQPDLGGAIMLLPIFGAMALVAGVRVRALVSAGILVALLGTGVWYFGMRDYQRERIFSFVSPESDPLGAGYQVRQSKIAVGSGEALGKGFMQGTQSQLRFLPARHTDFVFAVLAEEWGFAGVLTVLGLYTLFLYNGFRITTRARDRTGIFLVTGLLSVLTVHVLYNTAMVIGLVPVTGIPLPFVSYGGSFTLFCFFSAGVMLGVDYRRYVNR